MTYRCRPVRNLLELYLRVIPALPMQYEAYCLTFTRGDDLFQSDTKEAFLVLRQTVWIIPEAGEIPRESQQLSFLCVGKWVFATSVATSRTRLQSAPP